MSAAAPRTRAWAERKARLVGEAERVRRDLVAELPVNADAGLEESGARLASAAGALLRRQPVLVAALVFGVVAAGPRRVFAALRWAAVTLPLHPVGRRLIATVGDRLIDALSSHATSASRGGGRRAPGA